MIHMFEEQTDEEGFIRTLVIGPAEGGGFPIITLASGDGIAKRHLESFAFTDPKEFRKFIAACQAFLEWRN